jgi:hypothetical protein
MCSGYVCGFATSPTNFVVSFQGHNGGSAGSTLEMSDNDWLSYLSSKLIIGVVMLGRSRRVAPRRLPHNTDAVELRLSWRSWSQLDGHSWTNAQTVTARSAALWFDEHRAEP